VAGTLHTSLSPASRAYEAPQLFEIGSVETHTLTGLQGCYWGKQFGGTDGWTFMGINVPISNCSS
jgi:hypothetical protein